MTDLASPTPARWLLAAVTCLGLLAAPAPAPAAGTTLEQGLRDLPPDLSQPLGELTRRLRARDLPLSPLEQKLNEGLAKRVPPRLIAKALERMADNLVWLDDQLAGCEIRMDAGARELLFSIGNDLLFSGVTRERLLPAVRLTCRTGPEPPQEMLSRAAELYFFLVNKLAAPADSAWSLAVEVLRGQESAGAVSQLAGVLERIRMARGSVDRALAIALVRLQAGTPLRIVKNELRDQFLRP